MGVKKKYLFSPKPGYIYVRVRGKYLGRITAPTNTEAFDQQYWEILNTRRAVRTTWEVLIKRYRGSDRWTKLAPSTRSYYNAVLEYMLAMNGKRDVTKMERRHVIAAMDANKAARPRFAASIASVLSVLCEYAIDIGWIKSNPAKGVRKVKIPIERQKPHVPWTDEAVAVWRANSTGRTLIAFELGIGTVQRPGDLIDFTWGDYDGSSLRLRQNKTDVPLKLPCTPQLKRALDAEKAALGGAPDPKRRILTDHKGDPLTYSGFGQIMRKERQRLDLMLHDLHALRYRGIMELAWAGCTDDEIASYSGHTTVGMIKKYAGEARQIVRARQASEKRG